jgi:hypothetical protein
MYEQGGLVELYEQFISDFADRYVSPAFHFTGLHYLYFFRLSCTCHTFFVSTLHSGHLQSPVLTPSFFFSSTRLFVALTPFFASVPRHHIQSQPGQPCAHLPPGGVADCQ